MSPPHRPRPRAEPNAMLAHPYRQPLAGPATRLADQLQDDGSRPGPDGARGSPKDHVTTRRRRARARRFGVDAGWRRFAGSSKAMATRSRAPTVRGIHAAGWNGTSGGKA